MPAPADDWQRLSAWSIPHFVAGALVKSAQALLFAVPAALGVSRTRFAEFAWQVPLGIAVLLSATAVLRYLFTRFRVTGSAVEIRTGALFRRRINLGFDRIQNVSILEPFYFRPLGLAVLSIDSAGSAGSEVEIPALRLGRAEALRSYISAMRRRTQGSAPAAAASERAARSDGADNHGAVSGSVSEFDSGAAQGAEPGVSPGGDPGAAASMRGGQSLGERFFTRSLRDLVIYGLTNNRAFIVVAGILGFFWQSGISSADVVDYLGIDFDLIIAGWSLVRFTIMLVLAFIFSIGLLALLSVGYSIFSYYGFSMYRTPERLIVRRGLLNKHEIAVRKSRIQSIRLSQDWLDFLLGRRNIYLEQLTHAAQGQQHGRSQVMVPSVQLHETARVTDELWPTLVVEALQFTPLSRRWLRKYAIIVTLINAMAVVFLLFAEQLHPGFIAGSVAVWPGLMALVYMTWKRGGLAVAGDMIVARSGTVGINYRIFSAAKLQDIAHVQTPFMRRHGVSTLVFMTAASRIRVPYLPSEFACRVMNYCLYAVESRPSSWM